MNKKKILILNLLQTRPRIRLSIFIRLNLLGNTNRKIALRLLSFVEEIKRNPFTGTGKPERLKYQDANIWSRRLTESDCIVYMVTENRIDFIQARYHYSDR